MSLLVFMLAFAVEATAQPQAYCELQGDKLVPTAKAAAAAAQWYTAGEPLVIGKKSYVKYGFPQIMGPDDLQFWQSKDEVPVLTKAGTTDRGIVYVQSSGTLCEFQPYRLVTPEPAAKKTRKKG